MIDEYSIKIGGQGQEVRTRDDFLCCNMCISTELTMNTTNMSHGIVFNKDGVVIEYCCNTCGAKQTLCLFNDNVGRPQLTARINWVTKD